MPLTPVRLDGDKRSRANFRERRRVSEMNRMFDVLLALLPPAHFKMRLSRAQLLREAAEYIGRLARYLQSSAGTGDAEALFPHIFLDSRKSNKDSYRRAIKKETGDVQAYISSHDISAKKVVIPDPPVMYIPPPVVPIQQNFFIPIREPSLYIAYF